eukprot:GILK01005746.1.p1 GENE.GILK01005746.1~~GILK01005746.1.p1  ORF type:complete len:767 (-),score=129.87 GILK01005746.1:61-2277(-)
MADTRRAVLVSISTKGALPEFDQSLKDFQLHQDFGCDVFNDELMKRSLSSHVYTAIQQIHKSVGLELTAEIAGQVANAMRQWAVERGATHFSHWFQPMTGLTAEKHDSFLGDMPFTGKPILEFSGSALVRGEPDASSFPSGGIRSTFEARGYTVWDPVSPAFIRRYQNGSVLCIPTSFISWTGEALDVRTPLLRSEEALSRQALRLLKFIGEEADGVYSTLGAEQEFFMIDRAYFLTRPDLVATGRTVAGADPPKGQQMEDHYFGSIHPRVLACLMEIEKEAWRLSVPLKTRHNEVSPAQHEFAPIFERASIACDHNMILMELLRDTARKHGLECLLHEKPFQGVNGSGKHNNWSICTTSGDNLLEPGKVPHQNLRFMLFLAASIKAVDDHADVLRAAVASAANDFRLGANEAPPAIISVFLGTLLEEIVKNIISDDENMPSPSPLYKRNNALIQLGVSTLPPLPRDQTDRNRTSPFAFTGNKFEFRAVGSSQNCAVPITALNTAVADSLSQMAEGIENYIREGKDSTDSVKQVIKETLKNHLRVCFGGNGYSKEWHEEAAKRGLPNLRATPEALRTMLNEKNIKMWAKHRVFNESEATSRVTVNLERYVHTVAIESNTLIGMASSHMIPAALLQQTNLAEAVLKLKAALPNFDNGPQAELLTKYAELVNTAIKQLAELRKKQSALEHLDDVQAEANFCRDELLVAMSALRTTVDDIELITDDNLWPLPKYHELLFVR